MPDSYGDTVAFLGQLARRRHRRRHRRELGVGHRRRSSPPTSWPASARTTDSTRGWHPVRVVDHDVGRAHRLARAAGPALEELRPVVGQPARRRPPGRRPRAEHQRLGATRRPRTGRHRADARPRRGARRRAATSRRTTSPSTDRRRHPVGQVDQSSRPAATGDASSRATPTHGFQYVRIEGHPDRLTPDDVTGVVVHTDLRRTGWFRCSDERINRFHEIADWSFRGNACDIPTDCPQRERPAGPATGRCSSRAPRSSTTSPASRSKWLRDLAAEQLADGRVPNYAPDPRRPRPAPTATALDDLQGSSGWGDAIVIVPVGALPALRRRRGARPSSGRRWCAGSTTPPRRAATKRHPTRAAAAADARTARGVPLGRRFHWGEWLEPGDDGEPSGRPIRATSPPPSSTAPRSLAARIGRLLGHDEDAERFESSRATRSEPGGPSTSAPTARSTPDTQANHVRALAFGLVPDELRALTAARLVELIREAGTHLGTGFLATPYLLPVLADTGHLDVAYELLLQDTPPSWLTMVDRGATTVWEAWEGIDDDGVAHGVAEPLQQGRGHLVPAPLRRRHPADRRPGYRRFRIAPRPGGGSPGRKRVPTRPRAHRVSWRLDDAFRLTVVVPPGTTADLVLPDGTRQEQTPGVTFLRVLVQCSRIGGVTCALSEIDRPRRRRRRAGDRSTDCPATVRAARSRRGQPLPRSRAAGARPSRASTGRAPKPVVNVCSSSGKRSRSARIRRTMGSNFWMAASRMWKSRRVSSIGSSMRSSSWSISRNSSMYSVVAPLHRGDEDVVLRPEVAVEAAGAHGETDGRRSMSLMVVPS